jgi:serine/threonine protein kinase
VQSAEIAGSDDQAESMASRECVREIADELDGPYRVPDTTGEANRRSDLNTLGVVLYEMSAGQRCVPAGSHSEIMRAVISDAPIPLTTLNPAIPIQLARVVMKALEKSPENRFQSANAFRSALLEGNTLIEDTAVALLTFFDHFLSVNRPRFLRGISPATDC